MSIPDLKLVVLYIIPRIPVQFPQVPLLIIPTLIPRILPPERPGATTPLMDEMEQIGVVLRTQKGISPIFVSIGHRVDLASAVKLVLACCMRYRIPEPTRQADIEVAKLKRASGEA